MPASATNKHCPTTTTSGECLTCRKPQQRLAHAAGMGFGWRLPLGGFPKLAAGPLRRGRPSWSIGKMEVSGPESLGGVSEHWTKTEFSPVCVFDIFLMGKREVLRTSRKWPSFPLPGMSTTTEQPNLNINNKEQRLCRRSEYKQTNQLRFSLLKTSYNRIPP